MGVEELNPAPNDYLQRWPVSRRVNSSKADQDDVTLIDPILDTQHAQRWRRTIDQSRVPRSSPAPGDPNLAAGALTRKLWCIPPCLATMYRPRPTLAQLRRSSCWVWVCCEEFGCHHSAPWAYAPLIIRWGGTASSDMIRQCARCTRCGHKGASLSHPSWSGDIHAGGTPTSR